jgi:prolyl 4-hydroxylase
LVKKFWDANKDNPKPESWGVGNTYTNNWKSHSKMVSVEDSGLRGGGSRLKQKIWDSAMETISEWTGQELTQCSLYGIRIYYEGSVLASHVDRLPLVSSAIINVAQDVDEPWPLEVIGHDGRAQNVTMEPGDMVLYESHSVIHGRPFPLKGRYFANIFVHFEPVGHTLRHHNHETDAGEDVDEKYKIALEKGNGGHENEQNGGLPSYVKEGSPEADHWRQTHPDGRKSSGRKKSFATGSTVAHLAAQGGDIEALKQEVKKKKEAVTAKDKNGWQPVSVFLDCLHMTSCVVPKLISNFFLCDCVISGRFMKVLAEVMWRLSDTWWRMELISTHKQDQMGQAGQPSTTQRKSLKTTILSLLT